MAEQARKIPLQFYVSEQERKLIQTKMEQYSTTNLSAYLRKIAIDGYVVNLEIPELTECANLLRYISNNVNQMARHMNSGGAVYPDEARDICVKQDEINRLFGEILEQLSRLK